MIRALAIACVLAGCGPKPGPRGVTADDAIVYLTSNVRDAQVFVDGRFVAPLAALRGGIAVAPGPHRIELRHDGHFARYLELALGRAERKTIAVEMAAILP